MTALVLFALLAADVVTVQAGARSWTWTVGSAPWRCPPILETDDEADKLYLSRFTLPQIARAEGQPAGYCCDPTAALPADPPVVKQANDFATVSIGGPNACILRCAAPWPANKPGFCEPLR